MKKTLDIEISWEDKNYCCGYAADNIGVIACTDKTLDGVKKKFEESMQLHIDGMIADGDTLPQWITDRHYIIKFGLCPKLTNKKIQSREKHQKKLK